MRSLFSAKPFLFSHQGFCQHGCPFIPPSGGVTVDRWMQGGGEGREERERREEERGREEKGGEGKRGEKEVHVMIWPSQDVWLTQHPWQQTKQKLLWFKLKHNATVLSSTSTDGSVVEFSPATREARVRFPVSATFFFFFPSCHLCRCTFQWVTATLTDCRHLLHSSS